MLKVSIPHFSFFPHIPRIMPRSLIRPLGSAALDSVSSPALSISIDDPINSLYSDQIDFRYPLTPRGPFANTVYDTVDDDIEYRTKVTKKFYEKLFNSYLYKEDNILNYFTVSGNSIKKIKSQKEYDNNKLSNTEKKKVIDFIINNIYDKFDLKNSLKKFTRRTNTRWLELYDNRSDVKKLIFKDIKSKIKEFFKKN